MVYHYNCQTATARRADSEDQEDDDGKAQDAQDLIDRINEGKDQATGRIEDQHVIQFFKDKLLSMSCQNQGFIIDGFPKTIEQAKELFACKDSSLCIFLFSFLYICPENILQLYAMKCI